MDAVKGRIRVECKRSCHNCSWAFRCPTFLSLCCVRLEDSCDCRLLITSIWSTLKEGPPWAWEERATYSALSCIRGRCVYRKWSWHKLESLPSNIQAFEHCYLVTSLGYTDDVTCKGIRRSQLCAKAKIPSIRSLSSKNFWFIAILSLIGRHRTSSIARDSQRITCK